jgi:predicted nucleic acid-binding protein
MSIELFEFSWVDISEVLTIATDLELTVYDASYLWLSKKLYAPLITADDQLYAKAKTTSQFQTLHIKEYPNISGSMIL